MPSVCLRGAFYLRALRSLAANPASHVATITLTIIISQYGLACVGPRSKCQGFFVLVAGAALTCGAGLELILPGTPRDLVKLCEEKLVNWKTLPFFKLAHDVLEDGFVVSRQGPRGVAHVWHVGFCTPGGTMWFFWVFECVSVSLVLCIGRLRVGSLPFLFERFLHHLSEVFGKDCPVLASPVDVRDIVLVPAVLLHDLRCRGGDLHLVVEGSVRDVCRLKGITRDQGLHVLEKDLPLGTSAGYGFDVDTVVPCVLLRARGSIDLLLRGLGEVLEVLHRDLVIGSGALEVLRNGDTFGFREVLGSPARKARDFSRLGVLEELLGEEALLREKLESVSAVAGFRREKLVDDLGEGRRGGRHWFRLRRLLVACTPPLSSKGLD